MSDTSPAFPQEHGGGMTLREYFAGKAMQGVLSNGAYSGTKPSLIAAEAVRCADALINELNTKITGPAENKP